MAEVWHRWGRPKTRKIVDVTVTEITTQRYRCKNCGETVTAKPKGDRKEWEEAAEATLSWL